MRGAVTGLRRRALLAAVAALVPAACSGQKSGTTVYGVGDASIRVIDASSRVAAPSLSGSTLTGTRLSLADWAGQPVVINLWGSWCPPCRAEATDVSTAARTLMASGVRFVGLDIRESGGTSAALAYVKTFDVPFPSLFDPDGSLQLAFSTVTSVTAPPATVVLDRRHRVAAVVNGPVGGAQTLVDLVRQVTA